ncbi:MAG: hypothetical protein WAN65_23125, partial [Candidatus Sulfotelmatobacter sp.]
MRKRRAEADLPLPRLRPFLGVEFALISVCGQEQASARICELAEVTVGFSAGAFGDSLFQSSRNEGIGVVCASQLNFRKIFMHLAYLDDSQQQGSLAMFGAIVIPHGEFGWAERMHSIAVEQLFPADEVEEKFQEFHAYELFKGEGAFKGIAKAKRFDAITVLLMALRHYRLPFIYAAINEKKLAKSALPQGLFETAHPLIPAFKLCLLGIEKWAQSQHDHLAGSVRIDYSDQYLLIVDETKDQELKKRLRNSYRLLRAARPYVVKAPNRLWHAHDAMYFG